MTVMELEESLTPHPTQSRPFHSHLTDTDKQNTTRQKYTQLKKQTMQNTLKHNYPGSVGYYDTP